MTGVSDDQLIYLTHQGELFRLLVLVENRRLIRSKVRRIQNGKLSEPTAQ